MGRNGKAGRFRRLATWAGRWSYGDAKAQVVVPGRRLLVVGVRRPAVLAVVVPVAAPDHERPRRPTTAPGAPLDPSARWLARPDLGKTSLPLRLRRAAASCCSARRPPLQYGLSPLGRYRAGTKATRKPLFQPWVALDQPRCADRQSQPILAQLPPRITRKSPSAGPRGSFAGLLP